MSAESAPVHLAAATELLQLANRTHGRRVHRLILQRCCSAAMRSCTGAHPRGCRGKRFGDALLKLDMRLARVFVPLLQVTLVQTLRISLQSAS